MRKSASCSIGVLGTFDTDLFDDALAPRVLRRELEARLPGAKIITFAPYGALRPTPRDGGEAAEPLGRWSPDRAAALTAGLDCVLVTCTDPFPDRDRLARSYGVDRAVLDELDLEGWFIEGPAQAAEERCPVITFGSDPVVLAPRLFAPDLLTKRLEYLWLMGWYPRDGAAVVVEGDVGLLPIVPRLAAELSEYVASEPDLKVVLAELGSPGDAEFASELAAELPPECLYRLPDFAGIEDIAAAVANSAFVAGSSRRVGLVAQAYGRAWVALDPATCPTSEQFERARRTEPTPAAGPSLAARADAELDRIAEIAQTAALTHRQKETSMAETQRLSETEEVLGHLQVAHEARSRRLATERMVFANHLHKAEAEIGRLKDEVARLRKELAHAESRAAEAEAGTRAEAATRLAAQEELSALRATRTFRYTAELRSVYGRLRQLGESPPKPTGSPADPVAPADPPPAADSSRPAETKPDP
jgi:hypothetical protein